jgi:hypothetical protein
MLLDRSADGDAHQARPWRSSIDWAIRHSGIAGLETNGSVHGTIACSHGRTRSIYRQACEMRPRPCIRMGAMATFECRLAPRDNWSAYHFVSQKLRGRSLCNESYQPCMHGSSPSLMDHRKHPPMQPWTDR